MSKKKLLLLLSFVLLLTLLGTCSVGYSASFSQATIRNGITNEQIFLAICEAYGIDLTFTGTALTNYNNCMNSINNSLVAFEVFNYDATTSSSGTTTNRNDIRVYLFSPTSGVTSNVTTGTTAYDIKVYNTGSFTEYHSYYYYWDSPKRGFKTSSFANKTSYTIFSNNSPTSGARQKYCLIFGQDGSTFYERSDGTFSVGTLTNINFVPTNSGTITVSNNGHSGEMLKYNYSRSVISWGLGYITGFDNLDNGQFSFSLHPYYTNDISGLPSASAQIDIVDGNKVYNRNYGSIDGSGAISVNNRVILYNQGYKLTVFYDGELLYENSIYFLPYGDTSSTGSLISPDLNVNDPNIQQMINDLTYGFGQDSSNIAYNNPNTYGGLIPAYIVSGDYIGGAFVSGELLSNMGVPNMGITSSEDLIFELLSNIKAFLINNTDVTIPINVHGFTMNLNSANFTTPNSPIKSLCTTFLIAGFVFLMYQQIYHFTVKIRELDFNSIVNSFDVDVDIFM